MERIEVGKKKKRKKRNAKERRKEMEVLEKLNIWMTSASLAYSELKSYDIGQKLNHPLAATCHCPAHGMQSSPRHCHHQWLPLVSSPSLFLPFLFFESSSDNISHLYFLFFLCLSVFYYSVFFLNLMEFSSIYVNWMEVFRGGLQYTDLNLILLYFNDALLYHF